MLRLLLTRRPLAAFLLRGRCFSAVAQDDSCPRGETKGAVVLLTDVTIRAGAEVLLDAVSLRVDNGVKVALMGANGCGKSTILRCLAGRREVDGGHIAIAHHAPVGYMEQTAVGGSLRTVLEEAQSQMPGIRATRALAAAEAAMERAIGESAAAAAASALAAAREEYEAAGGPTAEQRTAEVLDGLMFSRERWATPCGELSGGWQMRVSLAKMLLSEAGEGGGGGGSLLLLDEPTNHLDAAACKWLGSWLKRSSATAVLVSHDEALLSSGACGRFVEVRGRALHAYSGTYAAFLRERAARAEEADNKRKRLSEQADKLEHFITRFGAKASKATSAKSKQKALDKILEQREAVGAPSRASGDGPGDANRVHLRLPPPLPGDAVCLTLQGAAVGWGRPGAQPPQIEGVDLALERGMRVVILGGNGVGKSTLLKALGGDLPLWAGARREGDGSVINTFSQDLAQELPQDEVALDFVLRTARSSGAGAISDERGRSVLGALGLSGAKPLRPIGALSGGEKARVVLAAFVLKPCTTLLLDEPSNHLDAAALRALTAALVDWERGAIVAVSHNRAFCEELRPTHVLRVAGGRATMRACTNGEILDSDFRDTKQSSEPVPPPAAEAAAEADEEERSATVEEAAQATAVASTAVVGAGVSGPASGASPGRLADVLLLLEGGAERLVRLEAEVAAAKQQKKRDKPRLAKLAAETAKLELLLEAWFKEVEVLQQQHNNPQTG